MRGRRCPELATGEVRRFVLRILAVAAAKLTRHVGALTRQQSQRILARTHMAICLAKYDAVAGRANTTQHPLAVKWLDSSGPLRQLILQFVHGAAPETLGPLAAFRAKARLASNLEVAIERCHAQLHRALRLAPRHSEAYASVNLRKSEIIQDMDRLEGFAHEMSSLVDKCGSCSSAVLALALENHPDARPWRGRTMPCKVACSITYHGDVFTQYRAYEAGRPRPPAHQAAIADAAREEDAVDDGHGVGAIEL
ncbi:unnamed protein product [Symbiodinium microadriaticum]|nr:unnamed protein product [Symbiodinium microadriaticum]